MLNIGFFSEWGFWKHYLNMVPLKPGSILVTDHGGGYTGEIGRPIVGDVNYPNGEMYRILRQTFPGTVIIASVPPIEYESHVAQTFMSELDPANVDMFHVGDENEHRVGGKDSIIKMMNFIKSYPKFQNAKFFYSFGGEWALNPNKNPATGSVVGGSWTDDFNKAVTDFSTLFSNNDVLECSYGYNCGMEHVNILNKYNQFRSLVGPNKRVWWSFGCASGAHRDTHIRESMAQIVATNGGIEAPLYFDYAPARKDLDISWFKTEGWPNGDPFCIVDYDGKPKPGYSTIQSMNNQQQPPAPPQPPTPPPTPSGFTLPLLAGVAFIFVGAMIEAKSPDTLEVRMTLKKK